MKFVATASLTISVCLASPSNADIIDIQVAQKSNFASLLSDITYSTVKGGFSRNSLEMDLIIPSTAQPAPVIVFVTGNGWRNIDRKVLLPQLSALAKSGYVVATIDYRVLGEASFPEPEKDVKTAVRFLRANATKFNIDPDRIGLFGNSAGGHLSALAGTTGGIADFEDEQWSGYSSKVQAVVAWYAPLYLGSWGEGPYDAASLHMGFAVHGPENADVTKRANPAEYLDATDPPFLLLHGTEDKLVPFEQSKRFHDDLLAAGVEVTLLKVNGAGHSFGQVSSTTEVNERVKSFFDRHLKGE